MPSLKIYEMGFLCWCNVKVKKILQEEATKIKQAELNHNYWKSMVFRIFAAKSSWKNNINDEGSTALYTASTDDVDICEGIKLFCNVFHLKIGVH